MIADNDVVRSMNVRLAVDKVCLLYTSGKTSVVAKRFNARLVYEQAEFHFIATLDRRHGHCREVLAERHLTLSLIHISQAGVESVFTTSGEGKTCLKY